MRPDLQRASLTTWLLGLEGWLERVEEKVEMLSARLDALEAPKPSPAPEAELWATDVGAPENEKVLRTVSRTR